MKNITQLLSDEHQNILKFINIVVKECEQIEKGKNLEKKFFVKAIDFIKRYADTFHHAKEEKVLFEAMLKNVDSLHCNPIPVMLNEHDISRAYVKEMELGIEESDNIRVVENAKLYCELLGQHIYKEDNVLYPMAEESLNEEEKTEILKQYKALEKSGLSAEEVSSLLSILE